MLDDVAAFLILAPLISTLAALALLAAWVLGGRRLGPKGVAELPTSVQPEVSVRRRT